MLASNLPFFFFHFFLLLPPLLPPSVLPQPLALATVFSVQCVFTLALLQASPVIRAVIITQASKQVQVQAKAEVTLAIRNGALFIYLLAAICLTGVAVSFVYAAFLLYVLSGVIALLLLLLLFLLFSLDLFISLHSFISSFESH